MPVPFEPGDRKLLTAAGVLLAGITIVGLLLGPGAQHRTWNYPSSYSAEPNGAKAAYLLLSELDYEVERWEQPPRALPHPAGHALLVLADPTIPASAEDKEHIRNFLRTGGRILATGARGAELLPEKGARPSEQSVSARQRFAAQLPGPLTRSAPEVEMEAAARWSVARPAHLPCYGDEDGATVVTYRVGAGQVIWWAGSSPLTNSGLKRASNWKLLLNSAGKPWEGRVLWDEYFHGQRPGLAAYLGRTPAPWLLVQLGVLVVAVLLTQSRRNGPVRPLVASGSRLSPVEFIETLGDLYCRKGAAPEAVDVVYRRFRFLLLRRLGLPSSATAEQVGQAAQDRLGAPDVKFLNLLQGCERRIGSLQRGEAEALRLIRELHGYTQRWRLAEEHREG